MVLGSCCYQPSPCPVLDRGSGFQTPSSCCPGTYTQFPRCECPKHLVTSKLALTRPLGHTFQNTCHPFCSQHFPAVPSAPYPPHPGPAAGSAAPAAASDPRGASGRLLLAFCQCPLPPPGTQPTHTSARHAADTGLSSCLAAQHLSITGEEGKTDAFSHTSTRTADQFEKSSTQAYLSQKPHRHGLGWGWPGRSRDDQMAWGPHNPPPCLPSPVRCGRVTHDPQTRVEEKGSHLGAPRRRAVVVLAAWSRPGPGWMAQGLSGWWQVHARQRAGLWPGGSGTRRAASRRPRLRLRIFSRSRQLGLRLRFLSST